MSDITKVGRYFTRSATAFDSLYSEKAQSSLMRLVNRKFRGDIHERFRLTLEHVDKYSLKTVLDVGCGSGRYELGLTELGVQRVVGIDVSPRMIDLAKSSVQAVAHFPTNLEFVKQDFMDFRTDETFDVVLAMGFFDYVQNPASALQLMCALARHSVVASFPSISWYRTPIRRARYFLKRCPVYFYRRTEIDSLARDAGFTRNETMKIDGAGQDYVVLFFK